jgi:PAS domain S-box-containing protein
MKMKIKKILIVDDNPANLYLLQTLLHGEGYDVVTAENGRAALNTAQTDPPDLVVSDILMPVMDGYALCRQWRLDERLKQIPFVFYTATYTDPKDEAFAESLGADRFILKPQEPELLLTMLQEVMKEGFVAKHAETKPLGEEMEFFRQHNEILFGKLEKKLLDLEITNQKLKLLEEQYRLSFEHVTDVIVTIDRELHIVSISPSIERLIGYKPQEFIGRPISRIKEIFASQSYEQAVTDIRTILRGNTIEGAIYQVVAKDGSVKFTEVSGSPVMRDGKISGIISVARDITERRQAEEKLVSTLESLRRAIGVTIQAMVSTVETRDPYTAGHQVRSADLARSIAAEMGLPQDRIDGIYMAGSIHDIGKLSVPSEILVKPTKLSDLEFSLIKVHALKGYEILRDVVSDWPLAEMVYQHHERMDGSGYPRNLKGDEILTEARILAVADVVESMASHRPYRPSLGIQAALDEITKNRGKLYDPEVVDACLRLFNEKGYQLLT